MRTIKRIGVLSCACLFSVLALTSCSTSSKGETGKSAYEIACDNGFEGTEAEWLASLKGTNGADGTNASSETTYEMYQRLVASSEFSGTYGEFLKDYLGNSYDLNSLMNSSLVQNVAIVSSFEVKTTTSGGFIGKPTTTYETQTYQGSGVIYDVDKEEGDAYIITAYHVIYESDAKQEDGICTDITCYLYGADSDGAMEATFIGGDISCDIAVLKIDNSDIIKNNSYINAVTFADSANMYIGESVYAIGNNKGQGLSANAGTLSLLSYTCSYSISDYTASVRSFRYDAATNAGDSGGAVYNEYGELLGIINCKMETAGVEGIQYAVPVSIVEPLAYKIVRNYEQTNTTSNTKCKLQITTQDTSSQVYLNEATGKYDTKATVNVYSLTTGGVAEAAGLAVSDIITKVELNPNGVNNHSKVIKHGYDISEFLYWAFKGDTLRITFTRDGVEQTLDVTLSYVDSI